MYHWRNNGIIHCEGQITVSTIIGQRYSTTACDFPYQIRHNGLEVWEDWSVRIFVLIFDKEPLPPSVRAASLIYFTSPIAENKTFCSIPLPR